MDIDHILDWQPPEVSQHLPNTPVFYRHNIKAASRSLESMSEGQHAREAGGTAHRHAGTSPLIIMDIFWVLMRSWPEMKLYLHELI